VSRRKTGYHAWEEYFDCRRDILHPLAPVYRRNAAVHTRRVTSIATAATPIATNAVPGPNLPVREDAGMVVVQAIGNR
jgi:hypothetical protein